MNITIGLVVLALVGLAYVYVASEPVEDRRHRHNRDKVAYLYYAATHEAPMGFDEWEEWH